MTQTNTPAFRHLPVLANEVGSLLITNRSGVYVDGTFGLGGHTRHLSSLLAGDAVLVGIDQDRSALAQFDPSSIQQTLHLVSANFENIDEILSDLSIQAVNGILLDLGLNSFSLDDPERGFSFSQDGPLDMRFDRGWGPTAADVVNGYSKEELANIIYRFGEERYSRRIAEKIVDMRKNKRLTTSAELRKAVEGSVHPRWLTKSLARVFQAIRIEVNRELEVLEIVLNKALKLLMPGGRIAVISYHSLEDRIVKQHFREWSQHIPPQPGLSEDQIKIPVMRRITRKPVQAMDDERQLNPRARSAKLRVAEKI